MNESSGIFSAQISGKDLQAEDYRQIHRGLLLWAYTRYIAYWHNKWSVSLPIRSINYCVFRLTEFAARRPRIRSNPFFTAACTSQKHLARRECVLPACSGQNARFERNLIKKEHSSFLTKFIRSSRPQHLLAVVGDDGLTGGDGALRLVERHAQAAVRQGAAVQAASVWL